MKPQSHPNKSDEDRLIGELAGKMEARTARHKKAGKLPGSGGAKHAASQPAVSRAAVPERRAHAARHSLDPNIAVHKKSTEKRRLIFWLLPGLVLLVAGGVLLYSNYMREQSARQASLAILSALHTESGAAEVAAPDNTGTAPAELSSASDKLTLATQNAAGVLELPDLNLTLPVLSDCTPELLELAPCFYGEGQTEKEKLVIAGHSYEGHFGSLSALQEGDSVLYTPLHGSPRRYTVSFTEEIAGDDTEGLWLGDWSLSLFTCNFDGGRRVVVRCIAAT